MFRSSQKQPDLLSNFDLIEIADMMGIPLQGVYSKDELINIEPEINKCYIVNLEDSSGGGTHWVAIIIDDRYVSYYDSFGIGASDDVKEFISRYVQNQNIQTIYSTKQVQYHDSVLCGYYCIYFLYFHMVLHSKDDDNKRLMSKHNDLFVDTINIKFNDKIIQKLIKNIIV